VWAKHNRLKEKNKAGRGRVARGDCKTTSESNEQCSTRTISRPRQMQVSGKKKKISKTHCSLKTDSARPTAAGAEQVWKKGENKRKKEKIKKRKKKLVTKEHRRLRQKHRRLRQKLEKEK
jgi:hypothetical protein